MSLAPGALAMITVAMTQKQGLEAIAAPAQIIDRIGSRPAEVANGLVGRFRNVDGFEFPGAEQSSKCHRVTAVGLYPLARTPRCHRGSHHHARDPELAQPTRNAESAWACFVAELQAWIPSVRLTKSRQQLFDSLEIVADRSIERAWIKRARSLAKWNRAARSLSFCESN
jgi:hypothetical protein